MVMTKSYNQIWLHAVFATKYREPLFAKDKLQIICDHILKYSTESGIRIDTINGWYDHLHILLRLGSTQNISKIMNLLKGRSARWINTEQIVQGGFKWQKGYGCFSVSPKDVPRIRRYIERQDEHHRRNAK